MCQSGGDLDWKQTLDLIIIFLYHSEEEIIVCMLGYMDWSFKNFHLSNLLITLIFCKKLIRRKKVPDISEILSAEVKPGKAGFLCM